jgi:hypothetical protein
MVHKLPHKFNWGLCSILFFFGHIQIINKAHELFSYFWSIDFSSAFSHFIIQIILSLISGSLCREGQLKTL